MNINQLEYFLALAKFESFSKAAEVLFVSQPAVSKQIMSLEKELGIRLFLRGYRAVTLTPAGRIIYTALSSSEELFKKALNEARLVDKNNPAEIRFGILGNTDFGNLFDIVAQFQKNRGDIVLHTERVPMSELNLTYPDGKYDIIINHDDNLRDVRNFEIRNLGKRRHMGCIAGNHKLCLKPDLTFSDLRDECFYMSAGENRAETVSFCASICASHGFTPKEIKTLPNIESVLIAVHTGMGVALLDDLIYIPPCYDVREISTDVTFNVVLAWHRENSSPAILELADEIWRKLRLGARGDRADGTETPAGM
jgi:DNA-binding transcriptional LysR family regulator